MLHCFEIKHKDQNHPPQCFAAETDDKRKTWVGYIQDAITQAHQSSGESHSGSDEGISLTTPKRRPLPPIDKKYTSGSKSEYSLDSDDEIELDPYDEVNDPEPTKPSPKQQTTGFPSRDSKPAINIPGGVSVLPLSDKRNSMSQRPKMDLPPIPGEQPQRSTSISRKESALPDYENDGFPPKTYTFNSKEKDKAHSVLKKHPPGTFMVRLGNSTPTVLSVMTEIGIKEFQITEDGPHVSIDRKTKFPSTPAMLTYYHSNLLPKNEYQVKLVRGYKS
ncbi:hypothetical protein ACF0H5_009767 [Mactra antiquata]